MRTGVRMITSRVSDASDYKPGFPTLDSIQIITDDDPGPPMDGTLQIITDHSPDDPGPQIHASIRTIAIGDYVHKPDRLMTKTDRTEAQKLRVGDLVLVHHTKDTYTRPRSRKLNDRWFGPYRIREIPENSTFYYLEELDGTPLAATFAGNRLKRFFTRIELDNHRSEARGTIRVRESLEREQETARDVPSEDVD